MSDLGFKGPYAFFDDSPIETSVKSAGAPATNLLPKIGHFDGNVRVVPRFS